VGKKKVNSKTNSRDEVEYCDPGSPFDSKGVL